MLSTVAGEQIIHPRAAGVDRGGDRAAVHNEAAPRAGSHHSSVTLRCH
jgi:hypothetical protein